MFLQKTLKKQEHLGGSVARNNHDQLIMDFACLACAAVTSEAAEVVRTLLDLSHGFMFGSRASGCRCWPPGWERYHTLLTSQQACFPTTAHFHKE